MNRRPVVMPAVLTASLGLAVYVVAVIASPVNPLMSVTAATASSWATPTSVTVSSVTAAGVVVSFVLPSADRTATSESVVVYPASNPGADAFRATVTKSPAAASGLKASTSYYAEVSVNATRGHSASAWNGLHHAGAELLRE